MTEDELVEFMLKKFYLTCEELNKNCLGLTDIQFYMLQGIFE